ncbi:hypothetical protein [Galactobacter valiniphilus]|uniref:hypothetical protein n=1 Tax=Galactobacter valiniphilus TaxID=2676122 RepID=UPI0037361104
MYEVTPTQPNTAPPPGRHKKLVRLVVLTLICWGLTAAVGVPLIQKATAGYSSAEVTVTKQTSDTVQRSRRSTQHLRTVLVEPVNPGAAWGDDDRRFVSEDAQPGQRLTVWFTEGNSKLYASNPSGGSVGEWLLLTGFALAALGSTVGLVAVASGRKRRTPVA